MCLECIFPSFFSSSPFPLLPSLCLLFGRKHPCPSPSVVLLLAHSSFRCSSCLRKRSLLHFDYFLLSLLPTQRRGGRWEKRTTLPQLATDGSEFHSSSRMYSRVTFCSAKYVFRPYKSVRALARRVNKGYAGRHVVGANDTFVACRIKLLGQGITSSSSGPGYIRTEEMFRPYYSTRRNQ